MKIHREDVGRMDVKRPWYDTSSYPQNSGNCSDTLHQIIAFPKKQFPPLPTPVTALSGY
jgi:hypothetical protein